MPHRTRTIAALWLLLASFACVPAHIASAADCQPSDLMERMRRSLERSAFVARGRFEPLAGSTKRTLPEYDRDAMQVTLSVERLYKGVLPKEDPIIVRFSVFPPLPADADTSSASGQASEVSLAELSKQLRELESAYAGDCLDRLAYRQRNAELIRQIRVSPEYHKTYGENRNALVDVHMGPIHVESGGSSDASGRSAAVLVQFGEIYLFMTEKDTSKPGFRIESSYFDIYSDDQITSHGNQLLDALGGSPPSSHAPEKRAP